MAIESRHPVGSRVNKPESLLVIVQPCEADSRCHTCSALPCNPVTQNNGMQGPFHTYTRKAYRIQQADLVLSVIKLGACARRYLSLFAPIFQYGFGPSDLVVGTVTTVDFAGDAAKHTG